MNRVVSQLKKWFCSMRTHVTMSIVVMCVFSLLLFWIGSQKYQALLFENQNLVYQTLIRNLFEISIKKKQILANAKANEMVAYYQQFKGVFNARQFLTEAFHNLLVVDKNQDSLTISVFEKDPCLSVKQRLCLEKNNLYYLHQVNRDPLQLLFVIDLRPIFSNIEQFLAPIKIEVNHQVVFQSVDWMPDNPLDSLVHYTDSNLNIHFYHFSNPSVKAEIKATRTNLFLISLLLAIIITYLLMKLINYRLLNPLARLSQFQQQIMQDSSLLGKTIHIKGHAEVESLSHSFNQMTLELSSAYQALKKQHGKLEDLVNERTSELLTMRDEALIANRSKNRFIANVGHEFRTPLNAMLGYCELLKEEAEANGHDMYKEDLDQLHASSRRLLHLVNDVLNIARLESGKMELHLSHCNLKTLMNKLITEMTPLINKRKNKLSYQNFSKNSLYADCDKVYAILQKLLDNANKFTQAGDICLTLAEKQIGNHPWFQFTVQDTGIGIGQSDLSDLFEIFLQIDDSTCRHYEGMGIGLALSQRFSQIMGGNIEVSSDIGKGSVFTLNLPAEVKPYCCLANPEEMSNVSMSDSESSLLSRSMQHIGNEKKRKIRATILIFNPTEKQPGRSSQFLTAKGFKIQTCGASLEGISLAKAIKPDIIIFETLKSDANSWALYKGLKSDVQFNQTPIIILTLDRNNESVYVRGIAQYVTKPIGCDYLLQIVNHLATKTNPVLLVEDEIVFRLLVNKVLKKNGWEVVDAVNGQQAIAKMQERMPSLVLLDIFMPTMNGFEFLEHIRNIEAWRSIPVVIISSSELSQTECVRINGWQEQVSMIRSSKQEQLQRLYELVLSCARKQ